MTLLIGTTSDELQVFLSSGRPADDTLAHAVAVAWVIDSDRRLLLLLHHRTLGWSCPGGHLELGESTQAAATRELREETGITATPAHTEPIVVVREVGCPRRPGDMNVVHWVFGYRFEVSSANLIVNEPGQPGRWFPIDALPRHRPSDIDLVLARLADARQRGV